MQRRHRSAGWCWWVGGPQSHLWLLIIGTIRKARRKKVRLFSLQKHVARMFRKKNKKHASITYKFFITDTLLSSLGQRNSLHEEEHRKKIVLKASCSKQHFFLWGLEMYF